MATGCLFKWNKQLLLLTVKVLDTPIRKIAIGTSQRAAGEGLITHYWPQIATGRHMKVYYMVGQGTSSHRGNTTAPHPHFPDVSPPSLSRAVDANVNGEKQTCFRTKAGKSGRLRSKPPIFRFRRPGRSTNPMTDRPQWFGSISAFRGSHHTYSAETLEPTRPTKAKCHATRHQHRYRIQDDVYSPQIDLLRMTGYFPLPTIFFSVKGSSVSLHCLFERRFCLPFSIPSGCSALERPFFVKKTSLLSVTP